MEQLKLNTGGTHLTISGDYDTDGELCLELDNFGDEVEIYLTKEQVAKVIAHLTQTINA